MKYFEVWKTRWRLLAFLRSPRSGVLGALGVFIVLNFISIRAIIVTQYGPPQGSYRASEVLLPKVATTLSNEPPVEQGAPEGYRLKYLYI